MICKKLPSIYVVTKNNDIFEYVIDQQSRITLEDINKFFKEIYGDNLKEITLGTTIGYLTKAGYEK